MNLSKLSTRLVSLYCAYGWTPELLFWKALGMMLLAMASASLLPIAVLSMLAVVPGLNAEIAKIFFGFAAIGVAAVILTALIVTMSNASYYPFRRVDLRIVREGKGSSLSDWNGANDRLKAHDAHLTSVSNQAKVMMSKYNPVSQLRYVRSLFTKGERKNGTC